MLINSRTFFFKMTLILQIIWIQKCSNPPSTPTWWKKEW
jgi:hypothetical protein